MFILTGTNESHEMETVLHRNNPPKFRSKIHSVQVNPHEEEKRWSALQTKTRQLSLAEADYPEYEEHWDLERLRSVDLPSECLSDMESCIGMTN